MISPAAAARITVIGLDVDGVRIGGEAPTPRNAEGHSMSPVPSGPDSTVTIGFLLKSSVPLRCIRPSAMACRSPLTINVPPRATNFSVSTSQIHDTSVPSGVLSFNTNKVVLSVLSVTTRIVSFVPTGFFDNKIRTRLPSITKSSARPKAA